MTKEKMDVFFLALDAYRFYIFASICDRFYLNAAAIFLDVLGESADAPGYPGGGISF